jgi:hypothetical protein
MPADTCADLWITTEEARVGTGKRFLFEGKIVRVVIPPGILNDTLLRLGRLKRRSIPFLRPRDVFLKIHVVDKATHSVDYTPYVDDDLNAMVECLVRNVRVVDEIDPYPLYERFENDLSVEKYAQAIFDQMKLCLLGRTSVSVPPISFESMDSPGQLVNKIVKSKEGFVLREYFWIEVNKLYRYHTRVLGAILAHELMHFIARRTGLENALRLPEIRVGSSFKQRPTKEVLVDIASILAGAGGLYQEAISVHPSGMRQVFGYIDPSVIVRARTLARDLLQGDGLKKLERERLEWSKQTFEREFGPVSLPRCRQCGEILAQSSLGHWTCKKCNVMADVV